MFIYIKKHIKNQQHILKDYFNNTPFIIAVFPIVEIVLFILNDITNLFDETYKWLIALILIFVLIENLIFLYILKTKYMKVSSLKLDKDTFLINIINNIMFVKKLKNRNEQFNRLVINKLNVTYHINKSQGDNPKKSVMDVEWEVVGYCNCNYLSMFKMVCTKSGLSKKFTPEITYLDNDTKNNNKLDDYKINHINDDICNCFEFPINKDGKLKKDEFFHFKININGYYFINWNDTEVLCLNRELFGDKVINTNIKIICNGNEIEHKNINVKYINPENYNRTDVKCGSAILKDNKYVFNYDENFENNKCIIFVIPKEKF